MKHYVLKFYYQRGCEACAEGEKHLPAAVKLGVPVLKLNAHNHDWVKTTPTYELTLMGKRVAVQKEYLSAAALKKWLKPYLTKEEK